MEKNQSSNPGTTKEKRPDNYTNFQDAREKILDLDIVAVIGKYTTLKKAGVNYKGLCPLHNEKTASFTVSPGKNRWHCFGCGKGGSIIDFIIEKKGLSFIDAIKDLASEYNIDLPEENITEGEKKVRLSREPLFKANEIAARHYHENLFKPENKKALDYVLSRWTKETIKFFQIGYASASWDEFLKFARTSALDDKILLEAGLIKEKQKGGYYDFFRNRIIFPLQNKLGREIAFTGRILPENNSTAAAGTQIKKGNSKEAKYLNTPETDIYNKGNVLYGLNLALKSIREKQFAYLVEGNPDVIRLQEININNVVAPMGTGLTPAQVKLLKPLIKSIHIIGDNDPAGQKAMIRAAEIFINEGIPARIIFLPDSEQKEDPDSFFKSEEQFNDYVKKQSPDYISLKVEQYITCKEDQAFKAEKFEEICKMIMKFNQSLRDVYIEEFSKMIKPKKRWEDKLKELSNIYDEESEKQSTAHSKEPDAGGADYFGFYEDPHGYKFDHNGAKVLKSNFILTPLYHIKSTLNAKRIFKIKNEFGQTDLIEFLQSDLVSIKSFRQKLGSHGDYVWWGSETEFHNLTRLIFRDVPTCLEITQLGWQKQGFFAWANGIYDGKFVEINEYGMIEHKGITYWIPWLSSFHIPKGNSFIDQRNFVHKTISEFTTSDFLTKFETVFGENGMISIAWYIATLFSDHIFNTLKFFPVLNFYGPTKTGKSRLAQTITSFFGESNNGKSYHIDTLVGLSSYVALFSNACVLIDEFENPKSSLDKDQQNKIMFLKNLHGRIGRTKGSKEGPTETSAVDAGVILCGEEKPIINIAILNRTIHLCFYKTDFSQEELENFEDLRKTSETGLTHITHEFLSHRSYFIDNYYNNFNKISEKIKTMMDGVILNSRVIDNWSLIIAAFSVMEDKIILPFNSQKLIEVSVGLIKNQHKELNESNDVSNFWHVVEYLYQKGYILEKKHFKIVWADTNTTNEYKTIYANDILYIRHNFITDLYIKYGPEIGIKVRDSNTIKDYIRQDKNAFIEIKKSCRIGLEINNAYAFYYSKIKIILHQAHSQQSNDTEESKDETEENKKNEENLPFQ